MFIVLLFAGGLLMGCSSEDNSFAPEQMISHALENSEKIGSYVSEATIMIAENEEFITEQNIKEWRHEDGRVRIEVEDEAGELLSVAVNTGEQLITHDVVEDQASIIDDQELIELNQYSPREQTELSLALIKDSHEVSLEGEEKIAGRDTQHLIATPKDENNIIGKQEMWIDQENWLVLKMINEVAGEKTEYVYENIEFDVTIAEEKFQLDLPDDVNMINLDDAIAVDEVSLAEASEALEQDFLYIPESDDIKISTIEQNDLQGVINRIEIDIDYKKDDLPYITLSMFETPEDVDDFTVHGVEDVEIRGFEATYTELENFRSVVWDEDGLRYSILIIDPNLTLEDVIEMTETMVPVNGHGD